jgi:membrane protein DedA with SNARE-associated domain
MIFHAAALPIAAMLAVIHPLASVSGSILKFLEQALIDYGYIIVFCAIMVESMGVPFPGETMLLIASAYAATSGTLSIYGVIACGAGGAMTGDSIGYWIGREGGRRLIRRYGKFVGLTDARYERVQGYLQRHGGKAIFFGRFVSIARTWIAVLVGAHHLNYVQFLLYDILGAITWATLYGSLGYVFGSNLPMLEKWVRRAGITVTIIAVAAIIYFLYLRRKRKKAKELSEIRGEDQL